MDGLNFEHWIFIFILKIQPFQKASLRCPSRRYKIRRAYVASTRQVQQPEHTINSFLNSQKQMTQIYIHRPVRWKLFFTPNTSKVASSFKPLTFWLIHRRIINRINSSRGIKLPAIKPLIERSDRGNWFYCPLIQNPNPWRGCEIRRLLQLSQAEGCSSHTLWYTPNTFNKTVRCHLITPWFTTWNFPIKNFQDVPLQEKKDLHY